MSEIPIACSLGSQGMKTRGEEWRSVVVPNVVNRAAIPGGVRLVLRASAATRDELERLIALENSCCAWINWTVREGSMLEVDATTDREGGATLLREWFGSGDRPATASAAGLNDGRRA